MRKFLPLLALPLMLSACGSSTGLKVSTNPKVRKEEAAAQKIVQGCISHGNFLTHGGRQKILTCIAPPGKKVQFQACAQKAIASGGFLTKGQRSKTTAGIADCLVKR